MSSSQTTLGSERYGVPEWISVEEALGYGTQIAGALAAAHAAGLTQ